MNTSNSDITLETTIKELKKFSQFNRNTLFLLKEFGAQNMNDILNINPYEFQKMKGVGPTTLNDLYEIQEKFRHLAYASREESAKLLDIAAQLCISKYYCPLKIFKQ